MILDFADRTTEDLFHGNDTRAARKIPKELWKSIHRKLDMVNAAHDVKDLLAPPGNRLEKLKGNLTDFYSIRINDQFRIVFRWKEHNAKAVRVLDYH